CPKRAIPTELLHRSSLENRSHAETPASGYRETTQAFRKCTPVHPLPFAHRSRRYSSSKSSGAENLHAGMQSSSRRVKLVLLLRPPSTSVAYPLAAIPSIGQRAGLSLSLQTEGYDSDQETNYPK